MKRCFIYHTDYRLRVKVAATEQRNFAIRGGAGLPHQPDARHDRAQRGRARGSQGEGAASCAPEKENPSGEGFCAGLIRFLSV